MSAFMAFYEEGETWGRVRLRWKYMPTLLPNGEVRLKLMVGAGLRRAEDGPWTDEPREFDISVNAC